VDLSSRIAVFIRKYRFLAKHKVREQDVEVFTVLPTALKRQLRLEAHGPVLCRQPFFYQLSEFDLHGLLEICNGTITELPLDIAQELFTPGQDALDTYFLLHGHVEYIMDEETWFFEGRAARGRAVLCEAALFVRFAHPGRVFCRTCCEFLTLSGASFRNVVPKRPMLHLTCKHYAKRLLLELREAGRDEQFDLGPSEFDAKQEMAQVTFEGTYNAPELNPEMEATSLSRDRAAFQEHRAQRLEQAGRNHASMSASSSTWTRSLQSVDAGKGVG